MGLQSDDLLAPVVAALADRVSAVEEVLAALTDHT